MFVKAVTIPIAPKFVKNKIKSVQLKTFKWQGRSYKKIMTFFAFCCVFYELVYYLLKKVKINCICQKWLCFMENNKIDKKILKNCELKVFLYIEDFTYSHVLGKSIKTIILQSFKCKIKKTVVVDWKNK